MSHGEGHVEVGRVLIAEPFMQGRHFSRSVIYMVEHGEGGSVGFVLNKPLHRAVAGLVPGLKGIECPVYAGGPVEPGRLYYLHLRPGIKGSISLPGGVYWGGDFEVLTGMLREGAIRPGDVRFFAGYSGWAGGQLAGELKGHSWLTGEIDAAALFSLPNEHLWEESTRALGGKYRVWANFPEDPVMN
jgi:putative transcriptional regulator